MYISEFRLLNYKSFNDSGVLNFSPGFNIIAGQNSAGKTALLEGLSLDLRSVPHRSLLTVPEVDFPVSPDSRLVATISFSRADLLRTLRRIGGYFLLPVPAPGTEFTRTIGYAGNSEPSGTRLVQWFLGQNSVAFQVSRSTATGWSVDKFPSYDSYPPLDEAPPTYVRFRMEQDRPIEVQFTRENHRNDIGIPLAANATSRIYRFAAERFKIGNARFGNRADLLPDASNLPEVLDVLTQNPARFREYNQLVTEIFPQIKGISIRPLTNDLVEILVWPVDPETQRVDLAIPLTECGTGIAQVLAILYIVLNSGVHTSIVLIDEPQSFLHPGAIRKLLDILRLHSREQFIIATHSPTVINAARPETITVLGYANGVTHPKEIAKDQRKLLEDYLVEVGARLSDVFGADRILWVEGNTEEVCFPEIIRSALATELLGTVVVGVRTTGDLDTRDAERILDIYSRLSTSDALLPPALAFVIDSECRTDRQKEDLSRRGNGKVFFLPRRMFENYLLDAEAIAVLLASIPGCLNREVTIQEVQQNLDDYKTGAEFFRPLPVADWERNIHGARVLDSLIRHFSNERCVYDKVRHGQQLTRWLLGTRPETFAEIVALLRRVLAA